MPTNYGVQGPNLGQYGGDTQYASPVVGQEAGIPIGGSGAGYLPSQEELRRLSEQNEKRARNQQMVQELQKIMGNMQTTPNQGLNAGSGNVMLPGLGGNGGNVGSNQEMARGFFGNQLNNPNAMEAPGGFGSQAFNGLLDSMLGGPSVGFGQGGGSFGGFDVAGGGGTNLGMFR